MAITRVQSERFPYLPVTLTVGEREYEVSALLDTGVDGDLAVPAYLLANDQATDELQSWSMADGSRVRLPIYHGMVRLGGFDPVPANIAALGDEVILGRGITDRYLLILDHGERVIVEL